MPGAMSASRKVRSALPLVACAMCGLVLAEDIEEPDMELLEYLGYWEESDEDWVMIEDRLEIVTDERAGPASQDEAPVENDDER